METLVTAAICHHGRICIATERAMQFVDLTPRIEALATEAGFQTGLVNIQTLHTTTAIVVNQAEPLLLVDFDTLLNRAAPEDAPYRHNDTNVRRLGRGELPNGHAHCQALLLGLSASVNFAEGRLQLGRSQRVFLVELDGPRDRQVSVLLVGEGMR
jgi:secondary thiamine-phosphate synthase enzyme